MRWAILAAVLLLVSGCYESNGLLLDPAAARLPIATGKDWTYGSGDRRYRARLTVKPSGWYEYAEAHLDANGVEGKWRTYAVVLNHLTAAGGYDVFVYGTYNKNDSAYMYGLVVVGQDGFWQRVMPNCDPAIADAKWLEADTKAALSAGGNIKAIDDFERVCHFTKRDQLFAAMRNVIATPGFWDRVKADRS